MEGCVPAPRLIEMPARAANADDFATRRSIPRALLIQYSVAILALVLVSAPLLPILYQSLIDRPLYDPEPLFTLSAFQRLLTHPKFYQVVWNSIALSSLTTIIATVVGVTTAVLIARTNIPMRRWLHELVLWPMYVSHLLLAFGWFMMYGPSGYLTLLTQTWFGGTFWNLYTITGMAVVAGVAQAPLVHLLCSSSAAVADASLEDAARVSGAGSLRVIWSVTIPLMRPAITYSVVLNFIGGLEMLSVPLIFGTPVGLEFFTTFLYTEGVGRANPDYGLLGAAAVLLLVLITVLIAIQGRLLRNAGRFVTVRGKATRPKSFDLGRLRWPLCAVLFGYFFLTLIVTVGGLFLRAFTTFLTPLMAPWALFTLDNFSLIFSYPSYTRSITNSILVAGIGAVLAVVLVALIAVIVHRSKFRFHRQLEFLALYPRAVPGIVAGLGFFWAMLLFPFMSPLYGTIWILIVAFTMRFIPTAYGAMSPMLLQIGQDLDRSARSCGADWWSAIRHVILPLLKPAVFSGFVLMFLAFLKEYASAAFLFAPGSEIIGTTMLQFWTQGDSGPVAALAVIQVAITAVFVTFARKMLGVKAYG